MKKTVTYNRIEWVTYEFTDNEIKEALLEKFKIAVPANARIDAFDIHEDVYDGCSDKITEPAGAELRIKYMLEDKPCQS